MKDALTKLFQDAISHNEHYHRAIEIARRNSEGDIWVIGGFVFRNLTAKLYGGAPFHSDIDIVVSQYGKQGWVPKGFVRTVNSYGTSKFISAYCSVDLACLGGWHSILRRNLEPTIENALSGTPLTIQSIAYDPQRKQIIGEIGIKAVCTRTVQVNDNVQAEYYAERKKKPISEIIRKKAHELGFALPGVSPIFD